MARPTTLSDATKLNFWFDGDTLEQLDALRRLHMDLPNRSEALRRLIRSEWQRHAPREPQRRTKRPPSVCEFLRRRGGIQDEGGDLRAMDAHRERPGLVNNRSGLRLDHARELLVEHGYLIELPDETARTSINDVLDLIRDELAGIRRLPDVPF